MSDFTEETSDDSLDPSGIVRVQDVMSELEDDDLPEANEVITEKVVDTQQGAKKRKASESGEEPELKKELLEDDSSAFASGRDSFSVHLDTLKPIDFEKIHEVKPIQKTFIWKALGNLVLTTKRVNEPKELKLSTEEDLDLNKIVAKNLKDCIIASCGAKRTDLSQFQREALSIIGNYCDLLFTERTFANAEELRMVYAVHALNHVLKTRSRVVHHNAKLAKGEGSGDYRDQGFTRPKVLILLPFRHSAWMVVKYLIALLFGYKSDEADSKPNVMNAKKFSEEFDTDEVRSYHDKPDDYKQTFAGNIDDGFRIGIAVTKKSLKLYSDFYKSDIIIASPLGLRTIIGAKGDKERDYDFLSSIEVLVLDQADVFLMQNWEHIVHIFKHLNLQPTEPHGCDFSRVRLWTLDGLSKYYRQTIVFSSVNSIVMNALFNREAHNYEGQVTTRNSILSGQDLIRQVIVQCPQRFQRFSCTSVGNVPEERFKFFVSTILPQHKDSSMAHTLIYIPSYFDFVRIRNYFRKEELNFTQICEYSKEGKVAQSRSLFFHGGRYLMLYTERAHFYHRYRIKGIRHLIFYELPTYPHFYSELSNLLHPSYQGKKFTGDESSLSVVAIYCKYDYPPLAAIVGTERAKLLLQSPTNTHLFVTENKAD